MFIIEAGVFLGCFERTVVGRKLLDKPYLSPEFRFPQHQHFVGLLHVLVGHVFLAKERASAVDICCRAMLSTR